MADKKVFQKYQSSDLAVVIADYLSSLQTPEGMEFKALHTLHDTIILKIGLQQFVIVIQDKEKMS